MSFKQNYIVFDFETGGLSAEKNPITEIGLVVLNEELTQIHQYDSLVKHYGEYEYQQQALQITGITLDLLDREGKDIKDVVKDLEDIFKKYKAGRFAKPILVGHNIDSFDMSFMYQIFNHCGRNLKSIISETSIDTMNEARRVWGLDESMGNYKLGTCCEKAQIELVNAHRSMSDVYSNADLFRYFTRRLRSQSSSQEVKEVRFRDNFEI